MKNRWLVLLPFILAACEKEITVDLPEVENKIVVQGSIEQGQPPFVLLTWSQGYFDPIDLNGFSNLIVRGAQVSVSANGVDYPLNEICSSDVPEDLLPLVTELTGFSVEALQAADICVYTSFDQAVWGQENTVYDLKVNFEDHSLSSRTKINSVQSLDSVWFELPGTSDSLGFAYAVLTDPDTLGNAYRWFARRINRYPAWSQHAGEVKDPSYIAPIGSAYDDNFFNGLSFEFAYYRGTLPNSNKEDDTNEESGFFKVGDTIAVKGTVIDRGAFRFITSFENSVSSQGSPFASPNNVESNVAGGLGAWIGYAAVYDTIICLP
ncbi:MAG: hypothetical protein RL226_2238 [Bacteroidota bacterium]